MRIPIHKEGFPMAGFFFAAAYFSNKFSKALSRILCALGLFTLYFFRDPEREIPADERAIVSPADGKILDVGVVEHAPFIDGPAKKISIFLSVFNVHINRIPYSGKVTYRQYKPGKFYVASEEKASDLNEQSSLGIETESGNKILVKQIAGLIARRVLCWKVPGDWVTKGERFGLIRFGSRTELYLPMDTEVKVKPGDIVKGASTVIALAAPKQ